MKPNILSAITRIAGDRLTDQMRNEIADEAIRIIKEANVTAALSAMESAKETLIKHSEEPVPGAQTK